MSSKTHIACISWFLLAACDPSAPLLDPPDASVTRTRDACLPLTCEGQGAECGEIDDGCGGYVECGSCPSSWVCGIVTENLCGPCPSCMRPDAGARSDASGPGEADAQARADASACVKQCAQRQCGLDPVCEQSCGSCPSGQQCSTTTWKCEELASDGPRILSFGTNLSRMTENDPLVFTAVLTDPDGVDDLIGGTLVDPASGSTYAAFSASASAGSYSLTLGWDALNAAKVITASSPAGLPRAFRARFFDQAGHEVSTEKEVVLACSEPGRTPCGGVCRDLSNDPHHCGACFYDLPGSGSSGYGCIQGHPGCLDSSRTLCNGVCENLMTSQEHCGACARPVPQGGVCEHGTPTCPQGSMDCGGTCQDVQSSIANCGACGHRCSANAQCAHGSCLEWTACGHVTDLATGATCHDVCAESGGSCSGGCNAGYPNTAWSVADSEGCYSNEHETVYGSCREAIWTGEGALTFECCCSDRPPVDLQCMSPTGMRAPVAPAAGELVITEVFANPSGTDDEREWIEVYVAASRPVDLNNLLITNVNQTPTTSLHRIRSTSCLTAQPSTFVVLAGPNAANDNVPRIVPVDGLTLFNSSSRLGLTHMTTTIDEINYGVPLVGVSQTLEPSVRDAAGNNDPAHWCNAPTAHPPFAGVGSPGAANDACP
ncbi:MAG: hypothetical protein HY901_08490 [Deltaproteobacteria bacterium]|nr:hypothetical protein [Deltaproteobacteria bacterium]